MGRKPASIRSLLALLLVCWPGAAHSQADSAASEADAAFDAIMGPQSSPAPPRSLHASVPWRKEESPTGLDGKAAVKLPLSAFADLLGRARQQPEGAAGPLAPAVLLAESRYSGRATDGVLRLNLRLQVTLTRPGQFKTVPLVGQGVVLARATAAGRPISVSGMRGYQVWVTRQTGEVTLDLDLVVPPRGPRGSIEFDLVVARTPVTSFSCTFPTTGLEPRLEAAVTSTVRSLGGSTLLEATLRPTTRIHLVGFKEMGETAARQARVYAVTHNLASVGERAVEVFSVIRYNILYAGSRTFHLLVPDRVTVVSADGKGAFSYTLERGPEGTLIRGETAFPIRDSYEISLRLRQETSEKGESFQLPLPRCRSVERETGWLAVEVPGRLRLREEARDRMLPMDVRHLPPELVRSAVSPILRAYRYHSAGRSLRLVARRLPEARTSAESIDRVRAFSLVSPQGEVLTEVRFSLRNRLRRSLALRLPVTTRVRSVLLDGHPARPSRNSAGQLLLPLRRSEGRAALSTIIVQVILEQRIPAPSWLGTSELILPAASLPVTALAWSVFLPPSNLYTALSGPFAEQAAQGRIGWNPPQDRSAEEAAPFAPAPSGAEELDADAAESGAMPVRIKLPKTGVRLEHERYWIPRNRPIAVSFSYLSRRLVFPALFALGGALALGLLLTFRPGLRRGRRMVQGAGLGLALLAGWAQVKLGGALPLALGAGLGLILLGQTSGWWHRLLPALRRWLYTLPARFRERDLPPKKAPGPATGRHRARTVLLATGRVLLAAGLALAGLVLLGELLHLARSLVL